MTPPKRVGLSPRLSGRSDAFGRSGAALLIVLGIVALLSVMVIAFLGSSSRQIILSKKTAVTLESTEVANIAAAQVLSDMLQEIRAGSVEPLLPWDKSGASTTPWSSTSTWGPVLYPATPLSAVPDRSSSAKAGSDTVPPPNLLKQSTSGRGAYDGSLMFSGNPVYPQAGKYPVPARASNVSTQDSIPFSRWNRPLLLPRNDPKSATNIAPLTSGTMRFGGGLKSWVWKAPDWVYLQRDGQNLVDPSSLSANLSAAVSNPVVARYAFQMYDVGGLLDLNVAGYDPDAKVVGNDVASRRGSIGLADLTQIGFTAAHLKKLVANRNPAALAGLDQAPHNNRYVNFLLSGSLNLGFLRVGNAPAQTALTNRAFASRQSLIAYVQQLAANSSEQAALLESLQSLTHFSRSLEQPSYRPGFYSPTARSYDGKNTASSPLSPVFVRPTIVPPAGRIDDIVYPITVVPTSGLNATLVYPALSGTDDRVATSDNRYLYRMPLDTPAGNNRGGNDAWGTLAERTGTKATAADTRPLQDIINPGFLEVRVATAFKRLDGSMAVVNEPLVKKRFPLERLAWVTYAGPSATLPSSNKFYNAQGTAQNVYDSFGLVWMPDPTNPNSYFWAYDHSKDHSNRGGIYRLEDLAKTNAAAGLPREPDFFELLKASLAVGSLGKSAVQEHEPGATWDAAIYNHMRDRSTNFQVLQVAANILDQADADSFPTVLKLANPVPYNLAAISKEADFYNPPLVTIRGVEDIPYFYRFHWRGVENQKDQPSPQIPNSGTVNGGIYEITDNISNFAGKFRCGTTSLIGIPELWNPHAQNTTQAWDAALVPKQFRVVAASETPKDVVFTGSGGRYGGLTYDKGFTTNIKLPISRAEGSKPITLGSNSNDPLDVARASWMGLLNAWNCSDMLIRPAGFTGYGQINTGYTPTWLHDKAFGTQMSIMGYNTNNWTWSWPLDSINTTSLSAAIPGSPYFVPPSGQRGLGPGGFDNRIWALFWNLCNVANPVGKQRRAMTINSPWSTYPSDIDPTTGRGARNENFFISLAPMWKVPASVGTDAYFEGNKLPNFPYKGWPAYSLSPYAQKPIVFQGKEVKGVSKADFLTPGDPNLVYIIGNTSYGWSDVSQDFIPWRYPSTPKISEYYGSSTYTIGKSGFTDQAALTYADGGSVPQPYPANRVWAIAMTDRVGRQLFQTSTATSAPASPFDSNGNSVGFGNGGNSNGNRTIDARGTELLFNLGSAALFREPTALCWKNNPAGSNLSVGPNNFFASAPYGGSVTGTDNKEWVGFSMGEVPTNYVVAAKMFTREMFIGWFDSRTQNTAVWWPDYNQPAIDVFQDKLGRAQRFNPVNPGVADTTQGFTDLRFFQVPVNLVGPIPGAAFGDNTKWQWRSGFTVRLQYQDPLNAGNWITYDERYMTITGGDNGRFSAVPTIQNGNQELQPSTPTSANPQTQDYSSGAMPWKNNGRPLGWGRPLITSYDPRTPRFGQPMRPGYNWPNTARGTNAQVRQLGIPSSSDPTGFFPLGTYNYTDRPKSVSADLPSSTSAPFTMTPNVNGPALFHRWFLFSGYLNAPVFLDSYKYATQTTPPDTIGRGAWWARGKHPSTGQLLLQLPSLNAVDYGWYSRSYTSPPPGKLSSYGGMRTGVSQGETSLSSFFNDAPSGNYADTLRIGDFSENIPPEPFPNTDPQAPYRQAYTDPDDVFRRASGGLAADGGYTGAPSAIEGLPMGQGTSKVGAATVSNRPMILNRPFRSVAELGYCFRGTPWKNLNFSMPETPDAALLDVFCLAEPPPVQTGQTTVSSGSIAASAPLVAGKVNLNTRQAPVLKALLAGVLKDETNPALTLADTGVSDVTKAAETLIDRTTGSSSWLGPLTNNSELAGKLFAKDLSVTMPAKAPVYSSTVYRTKSMPDRNPDMTAGKDTLSWHYTGYSADLTNALGTTMDRKNQRLREAAIRALADGGQTRVWNVMVDLIVQTGRTGLGGGNNFTKDGEARCWVYFSIDRLSGDVLDQQVEWVTD